MVREAVSKEVAEVSKKKGKEKVEVGSTEVASGKVRKSADKRPKVFDLDALLSQMPPKAGKASSKAGTVSLGPLVEASSKARASASPAKVVTKRVGTPSVECVPHPTELGKHPCEATPEAPIRHGYVKELFGYGIIKQFRVKSLCDSTNSQLAWDLNQELVSKHDSTWLSSLLPDELERQICANFGKNVQ